MDVYFRNRKLERVFNSEKKLKKEYGQSAQVIKQRLSELKAVNNLSELFQHPSARCHELKGELKEKFAVDLKQPFRLIFEPFHNPIPRKDDGGIDLTKVTAICIIDANVNYH